VRIAPRRRIATAALCALSLASGAGAARESLAAEPVFSFRADHMVLDAAVSGSKVLVGTQSGRVDAFDWRDGSASGSLLATRALEGAAFAPTVTSVATSPSGAACAVVSSDGRLQVFRLHEGRFSAALHRSERTGLLLARFLDDNRLLVGDMRGEIALIELASGREVYRRQLEYDPIYALAPSPDGRRVAVAFRSSRIQILSADSGETQQVLKGHRDSVYGLVWLASDELASASKDKSVLAWDLTGRHAEPRSLYAGDHYVTALGFDRRKGILALPLQEHQVGLLRLADGRMLRQLRGHSAPVQSLLFLEDGERLVSAGNDARVLVWDLSDAPEGMEQ